MYEVFGLLFIGTHNKSYNVYVSAPGLDRIRVAYLYKHIRPFVEEYRDVMCPAPVDYQENDAGDAEHMPSCSKRERFTC